MTDTAMPELDGVILTGPLETTFQLAEEPEDKRLARSVQIRAHSGKIIKNWSPFYGHLAIDMSGMKLKKGKSVPILEDHIRNRRLGASTTLEIEDGVLNVGAKFLRRSQLAESVLNDMDDGFPFQASIWPKALRVQLVEMGQEAEVNGQKMKGPGIIMRESELMEVSIVTLGADSDTSAVALADKAGLKLSFHDQPKKEAAMAETATATVIATVAALCAAYPELTAQLSEEATQKERSRCSSILSDASPRQIELASKAIADGSGEAETLRILLKDSNEHRGAELERLRAESPEPAGAGDVDDEPEGRVAKLSESCKPEERWDQDEALRLEYGGDKDAYLAFERAKEQGCIID